MCQRLNCPSGLNTFLVTFLKCNLLIIIYIDTYNGIGSMLLDAIFLAKRIYINKKEKKISYHTKKRNIALFFSFQIKIIFQSLYLTIIVIATLIHLKHAYFTPRLLYTTTLLKLLFMVIAHFILFMVCSTQLCP